MIPLYRVPVGFREFFEVSKVLNSNEFTNPRAILKVEYEIQKITGAKYVVTMANGTLPLLFALRYLRIGPGDEVIVPTFSFVATANVVKFLGANPVYVDVQLQNYGIDIKQIKSAVSKRTKAIIVVHEFGFPVDIESLRNSLKNINLPIVEDAACALGSSFNSKMIGEDSFIATFSFHPRKIVTSGEGGAIATNSKEVADAARNFRNHGIDQYHRGEIEILVNGINARLSVIQAAILLPQLKKLGSIIRSRNQIASVYLRKLDSTKFHLPSVPYNSKLNWQSFLITPKFPYNYEEFALAMREKGISVARGAQYLPGIPVLSHAEAKNRHFPVGRMLAMQGFCLPIFFRMKKSEATLIAKEVNSFFESRKLNDRN